MLLESKNRGCGKLATGKSQISITDFRSPSSAEATLDCGHHWKLPIIGIATQSLLRLAKAGKDVYVEKTMATYDRLNVIDGQLQKNQYNRIMQVGQQQRSGQAFIEAKGLGVKSGYIGKSEKSISGQILIMDFGKLDQAYGLQYRKAWDYWFGLGPATFQNLSNQIASRSWRNISGDLCGGLLSDWGVHYI